MAFGLTNRCSWLIPAVLLLMLTLALAKPSSPSVQDYSVFDESCGINMVCVPRKLCRDKIIKDDGVSLITPIIGQTGHVCSRVLDRCCKVPPKEDNVQT